MQLVAIRLTIWFGMNLLAITIYAQNLVPNSSFEEFKKDPCKGKFRSGGERVSDYIANWYVPTLGTTDIYTSDSTSRRDCEIYSFYKKAQSGSHMAGILTCFYIAPEALGYNDPDYREYFQVRLIKPMTPGRVYSISLFASLLGLSGHRTNNLGLLFSVGPVTQSTNKALLTQSPQVNNASVLADTNWHQLVDTLVADKAYQYLTFGNFYNDKQTVIEATGKNPYIGTGAYYYIDDITVTEVPNLPLVTIPTLGTDTTLCSGNSLAINLPKNLQTYYVWQDGSTATTRTITQAGTYYVTATTGVYSVTDTLHVNLVTPVRLPLDTIICQGEHITLIPTPTPTALVWSDSSTDSTLTVSQPGQYWVHSTDRHCPSADTIQVQVVVCPTNVPNVFTPNGDGKNETFFISNIELRSWRLEIYNRWGSRVYESEPYLNQWRGEGLPEGVYYYGLYCESLRRRLKGWVTILR